MRPIVEIYFYPRPPRGGRHNSLNGWATDIKFLSTPSARRATKRVTQKGGDRRFLSTPSARRATSRRAIRSLMGAYFYPRPPRGGRPTRAAATDSTEPISIHALREEGDDLDGSSSEAKVISIHALREEGDAEFAVLHQVTEISIHALREEGDSVTSASATRTADFYPRPPRGGRPSPNRGPSEANDQFLSTPSARRATWCVSPGNTSSRYFYPRPPRGGCLAPVFSYCFREGSAGSSRG